MVSLFFNSGFEDLSAAAWKNLGEGLARCYWVGYTAEDEALALHPFEGNLACPLSLDVAQEPVMTVDGQVYDKQNIQQWFRMRYPPTSPCTGLRLLSTILFPLPLFKGVLQSYINSRTELKDCYIGLQAMEEMNCELRNDVEKLKADLHARDTEVRRLKKRVSQLQDARDCQERLVRGLEVHNARLEDAWHTQERLLEIYHGFAHDSKKVQTLQACVRGFLSRKRMTVVNMMQRLDDKETKRERQSQNRKKQKFVARAKRRANIIHNKRTERILDSWMNKRRGPKYEKQELEDNAAQQDMIEGCAEGGADSIDFENRPGRVCCMQLQLSTLRNRLVLQPYTSEHFISRTPTRCLCATELPPDICEHELWHIFGQHGELTSVRVEWDASNRLPCAFLEYLCEDDAQRARDRLNGVCIRDHLLILVRFADLSALAAH